MLLTTRHFAFLFPQTTWLTPLVFGISCIVLPGLVRYKVLYKRQLLFRDDMTNFEDDPRCALDTNEFKREKDAKPVSVTCDLETGKSEFEDRISLFMLNGDYAYRPAILNFNRLKASN